MPSMHFSNNNGWYLLPLAGTLQENPPASCLKELTIESGELDLDSIRALVALVRDNHRLERLHYVFVNHDAQQVQYWREINFYLNLNRHGRQRWIQRGRYMTRNEWIAVLANHLEEDDASSLFYILRRNPWLFA